MKSKRIFWWFGLLCSIPIICLVFSNFAMAAGKEILIGAPVHMTGRLSPDGM